MAEQQLELDFFRGLEPEEIIEFMDREVLKVPGGFEVRLQAQAAWGMTVFGFASTKKEAAAMALRLKKKVEDNFPHRELED